MQGCCADEKIREANANTAVRLLPVNPSSESRDFQGQRVKRQSSKELFKKILPALPVGFRLRPINAMF